MCPALFCRSCFSLLHTISVHNLCLVIADSLSTYKLLCVSLCTFLYLSSSSSSSSSVWALDWSHVLLRNLYSPLSSLNKELHQGQLLRLLYFCLRMIRFSFCHGCFEAFLFHDVTLPFVMCSFVVGNACPCVLWMCSLCMWNHSPSHVADMIVNCVAVCPSFKCYPLISGQATQT